MEREGAVEGEAVVGPGGEAGLLADRHADDVAALHRVANLAPGDTVEITRADGSTAVFVVDRGEQHAKNAFPTRAVYGNTAGAELRLITCDGYNAFTREFEENHIVYATLVDVY